MTTTLDYLNFDYSEDDSLQATWDAMAYVRQDRIEALLQEVSMLLQWACAKGVRPPLPVDEGGVWDFDLQAQDDAGHAVPIHVEPATGQVTLTKTPPSALQLSLTLTGTEAFAHALNTQFRWD